MSEPLIDTTFDFRRDSNGRDPDSFSATLKRYHHFLWNKPLPDGRPFDLAVGTRKGYLYHNSELGEFVLTSDSVLPTFDDYKGYMHVISQLPQEEIDHFAYITYTIGGMMIFPGTRIDGKRTINGERGCHPRIKDRFDLTVESIRRFYKREQSPLFDVLDRYSGFFRLFGDFEGYVDFFLLQDLVSADHSSVRFFTRTVDFDKSPLPEGLDGYKYFRERTFEFVHSRNARIAGLYG